MDKVINSCNRKDCFACVNNVCRILNDTEFGKRECPFFKLKQDLVENKKTSI